MVWFQCEDCGETLKKPKVKSHVMSCSASRLACIDCGVTFNRTTVQAHNTCMTEMEKFGPKGENAVGFKAPGTHGSGPKPGQKKDASADDGFDYSMGLSARGPWKCSICNVHATSYETLVSHSEGKKHRAKVRTAVKAQGGGAAGNNSNAAGGNQPSAAAAGVSAANGIAHGAGGTSAANGSAASTAAAAAAAAELGGGRDQEAKDEEGILSEKATSQGEKEEESQVEKKRKRKAQEGKQEGSVVANGTSDGESRKREEGTQKHNGVVEKEQGGEESEEAEGKKKRRVEEANEDGENGGPLKMITRIKKAIRKVLKQAAGSEMKLKQLKKKVLAALQSLPSDDANKEESPANSEALSAKFDKAVMRCKTVVVDGRTAKLSE